MMLDGRIRPAMRNFFLSLYHRRMVFGLSLQVSKREDLARLRFGIVYMLCLISSIGFIGMIPGICVALSEVVVLR